MKKKRFSITQKMRLLVILTVLIVSFATMIMTYYINAHQIDGHFKRMTYNSAENFATFVDPEFLSTMRTAVESKEYQELRKKAQQKEDESLIENYLKEKGLWEEYSETKEFMCKYIENMDDIKYLYIIVISDAYASKDMFLIDDFDNPLYHTGCFEDKEPELKGVNAEKEIEPVITNNRWGWLCSAYAPVKDKAGNIVCHIGCDVDVAGVMNERIQFVITITVILILLTAVVMIIAVLYINRIFTKPIKSITTEAKRFKPGKGTDYKDACVIDLYLKNEDELSDIYSVIQTMQKEMVDHLNDMSKIEKERQRYIDILRKVESDNKTKENLLEKVSKDAYHDELTKVGNKSAYVKKVDELSKWIAKGTGKFAIAMIDLNNLKFINDYCGHKAGDVYIKGSCGIITSVFKHSNIYRIGGDEFVVIMIGEDYKNRDALISQVKDEFQKSYYNTINPPEQRYSASVGMAVFADGDMVETVFKRADQAMYADKMLFKTKNGSYR